MTQLGNFWFDDLKSSFDQICINCITRQIYNIQMSFSLYNQNTQLLVQCFIQIVRDTVNKLIVQ